MTCGGRRLLGLCKVKKKKNQQHKNCRACSFEVSKIQTNTLSKTNSHCSSNFLDA